MASTTIHYPTDKEQLSCWTENEELALVTGENFFDEYVTFDPTEFLDEPQSPSMLLDSLDDSLTNSSNDQDVHPPVRSFTVEGPRFLQGTSSPPTQQQARSVPAVLGPADPVMGGGSISDSELLRLEGISLRSPRANATAPSSPPQLTMSSSSLSSSAALSPSKRSRIIDSVYATIRKATHRPRPHRTHTSVPVMEALTRDSRPLRPELEDLTCDSTADNMLDARFEPIDSNGLPLSPPLTGKIPSSGPDPNNTQFVTGHLDDPFCDVPMVHSVTVNPAKGLSTPMNTPALKDGFFYQNEVDTINPNNTQIRRPKQRNTSSAEWPMEGIITDDSQLWSSSSYIPDSGTMHSPGWWDDATSHNNSSSLRPNGGGGTVRRFTTNSHNTLSSPSSSSAQNGVAPRTNIPINLAMHNQQAELPYEYVPTTEELSGLMIHMPQPRQPQAAVLTVNIPDQLLMTPTHSSSATSYHHRGGHYTDHTHNHHHHHQHRRPQPRAPSSGARHHLRGYHSQGSLTSPRKQGGAALRRSSSRSMLVHREESVSPSPVPVPHAGGSGTLRRRSSSISVRKQRSWSSRRGEPRTPRVSLSGGSFGGMGMDMDMMGSGEYGGGGGGGGGAGGVDFVNFTPSDKNILMTGVAPSGSSKTKARREKEAMERRRQLSEAAVKAVQAAGGDVERLAREGLLI